MQNFNVNANAGGGGGGGGMGMNIHSQQQGLNLSNMGDNANEQQRRQILQKCVIGSMLIMEGADECVNQYAIAASAT